MIISKYPIKQKEYTFRATIESTGEKKNDSWIVQIEEEVRTGIFKQIFFRIFGLEELNNLGIYEEDSDFFRKLTYIGINSHAGYGKINNLNLIKSAKDFDDWDGNFDNVEEKYRSFV